MPGVTTTSGSMPPAGTTSWTWTIVVVGAVRLDEGVVGADRQLEHVVPAVDLAHLLALGERGAVAGRGEERADAGPGRADALGEVALRHELELDLAGAVLRVELVAVVLPRERADDPAHPARADQRRQPDVAVAGVVVDDGEVARAALDERLDELHRLTGRPEAADEDGGAVGDVGDRVDRALGDHDHDSSLASRRACVCRAA